MSACLAQRGSSQMKLDLLNVQVALLAMATSLVIRVEPLSIIASCASPVPTPMGKAHASYATLASTEPARARKHVLNVQLTPTIHQWVLLKRHHVYHVHLVKNLSGALRNAPILPHHPPLPCLRQARRNLLHALRTLLLPNHPGSPRASRLANRRRILH